MSSTGASDLVKWYPSRWRARYGDELVTLMEDTYGTGKIPPSNRLDVMRAGVAERFRELRLGAGDPAPVEQVRTGSLLVLWGWAVLVVAGAAFAKMIENWDIVVPRGDRWLPVGAYAIAQWVAGVGAVVVLVAAAAALPAFARFLGDGGWALVRRPVGRVVVVSSATLCSTIGMILWVHHIGPANRSGGLWPHLVGVLWALMVATSIGTCTSAAVSTTRRLRFSPPLIRLEGLMALLLASAMLVIVAGMIIWVVAIATDAPRLLSGNALGLLGAPAILATIAVGLLVPVSLAIALSGAGRVVRSIRAVLPE